MSFMRGSFAIVGGSITGVTGVSTGTLTVSGTINMMGQVVSQVGDPTVPGDAANKSYVDSSVSGLAGKEAAVLTSAATLAAATFANDGTITADGNEDINSNAAFSGERGGYTLVDDDRILVLNDAASVTGGAIAANSRGVYVVTNDGQGGGVPWVLTRADDANQDTDFASGYFLFILRGATNADNSYIQTNEPVGDLNTDAGGELAFAEFGASGGVGLGDNNSWTGTNDYAGASTTISAGYLAVNNGLGLFVGTQAAESGKLLSDGTDLTISNAVATGKIINTLNTSTSATEFQILGSATARFAVRGDGVVRYGSTTQALTGDENVATAARVVYLTADNGARTATLLAGVDGQMITIVNIDTTNAIALTITLFLNPGASGAAGNATVTLTNSGQGVTLVSDGTNWINVAGGFD